MLVTKLFNRCCIISIVLHILIALHLRRLITWVCLKYSKTLLFSLIYFCCVIFTKRGSEVQCPLSNQAYFVVVYVQYIFFTRFFLLYLSRLTSIRFHMFQFIYGIRLDFPVADVQCFASYVLGGEERSCTCTNIREISTTSHKSVCLLEAVCLMYLVQNGSNNLSLLQGH